MKYTVKQLGALLNAIAGDAALATRTTASTNVVGGSRFYWTAALTYGAATAVTITPYKSNDEGTTWVQAQAEKIASDGTATLSDYAWTKSTGSGDITMEGWLDVIGATHVKLIASFASGSADDSFTLKGSLAMAK